jgi:hypothetical protein
LIYRPVGELLVFVAGQVESMSLRFARRGQFRTRTFSNLQELGMKTHMIAVRTPLKPLRNR